MTSSASWVANLKRVSVSKCDHELWAFSYDLFTLSHFRWSGFAARVNHEPIRVADSTVIAHDTNTQTSSKGNALLSWFSRRWAALASLQLCGSGHGIGELFQIYFKCCHRILKFPVLEYLRVDFPYYSNILSTDKDAANSAF